MCVRYKWNGKTRLACDNAQHLPSKSLAHVPPWTGRSEGQCPSISSGGKNGHHKNGLRLGRSEVLRSLRHYLRARSQEHHTIDRFEEGGMKRGSARRSSLNERERAIVSQTSIGIVSNATFGVFRVHRYYLELDWIQQYHPSDEYICILPWFNHSNPYICTLFWFNLSTPSIWWIHLYTTLV